MLTDLTSHTLSAYNNKQDKQRKKTTRRSKIIMTIEDIIRSLEDRNREIMDCYDLIEDGSEIITVPVWEDDGESAIDDALITERERIIDMLREVAE